MIPARISRSAAAFFGVILSLAAYEIGLFLKKKLKHPLANPLLIAVALTIAVLAVSGIDYDVYYEGAKIIGWFLTPATVCLAIPLYEQVSLIKKYPRAILAGILTGVETKAGYLEERIRHMERVLDRVNARLAPEQAAEAISEEEVVVRITE